MILLFDFPVVEITILINAAGIAIAGLTSYIGMRVAITEIRKDTIANAKNNEELSKRVDRLERPYFDRQDYSKSRGD